MGLFAFRRTVKEVTEPTKPKRSRKKVGAANGNTKPSKDSNRDNK